MAGFAHKLCVHGCRHLNSITVNVCVVTCKTASGLLISPPILGVRVHRASHDLQKCRRWREIWEQPVSTFDQGLKLMPVVCHLHTVCQFYTCSHLPWSGSGPQHPNTSKITKPTSKCCYALHSYVGTIFSHDKLLA